MYRTLVMFPKSADPIEVDTLIEAIASSFSASGGCQGVTCNAGALMGPAARDGDVRAILEADFVTLEDAMGALKVDGFQEVKARTEALGTTLYLFELRDI